MTQYSGRTMREAARQNQKKAQLDGPVVTIRTKPINALVNKRGREMPTETEAFYRTTISTLVSMVGQDVAVLVEYPMTDRPRGSIISQLMQHLRKQGWKLHTRASAAEGLADNQFWAWVSPYLAGS